MCYPPLPGVRVADRPIWFLFFPAQPGAVHDNHCMDCLISFPWPLKMGNP